MVRRSKPSKAIARVNPAAAVQPWELNNEQVALLKNYLKMGDASELEVKSCLEVARRYRLDAFKQGQIWFIKRWDKNATTVAGTKGAYTWIPQVGIYGMLHIAARDYRDFGSLSEVEYGPMITHEVEGHKFKAPEWCRVKAFKKGLAEPTVARIYFEEFCPNAWENARLFWARAPRAQIEKCCKARVLRSAYPDLGGLYIPEEMDRMRDDYTPGGREIVRPEDRALPALAENAPHGHELGSEKAKQAEATLARVEAADKELKEKQTPKTEEPVMKQYTDFRGTEALKRKHLEIDLTNPQDPIVRGDTGDLLPQIETRIVATWRDEWWHVRPVDVDTIHAAGRAIGFDVTEFQPVPTEGKGAVQGKAAPASAQTKTVPQTQRKENKTNTSTAAGGSVVSQTAGEPSIIGGTIQHFTEKMTKGSAKSPSAPYLNVLLKTEHGDRWYSTFDRDLFEYISKAKGKSGEFIVKQSGEYWNLLGFKTLAGRQFEDGKILVVNRDREAGKGGTLFQP